MNEDRYNLYDNLVAASILNLNNFSKENGKIILKDFDIHDAKHMFLFNTALISCMYKDINRKIYLDTNLIDYIKIKWKNRKRAKIRKYNPDFQTDIKNNPINIEEILDFMADAYEVNSNIFIDIYGEYYDN